MTPLLTDRYRDRLAGVLSCYDRIVITGTLPGACFAEGMTKLLRSKGIRIFDYPAFAATLRDRVREAAATVAASDRGDDRARRQEPHSQGSGSRQGSGGAWRSSRPGACHFGDGGVRRLPALAR